MKDPSIKKGGASSLRKGRTSEIGRVYSITKCTYGRKPVLLYPLPDGKRFAALLVDCLKEMQGRGFWGCFGFVIMPDHLHFVVKSKNGSLSASVGSFSQFTSRQFHAAFAGSELLWQEGFHDHAVRNCESLDEHLRYIMENPVRAGLARTMEDWPHGAVYPDW